MGRRKLTKINGNNFAIKEKNSTFAESDEPTALAYTDLSKPSPILEGEDAIRFLENARKAEEGYEKRKKEPLSLDELKRKYSYGMMVLEIDKESIKLREKELNELQIKIKELERKNGEK